MVWECQKTFDDMWTSVLSLIQAFVEIDLPEEGMLLLFCLGGGFHHDGWADFVDKRLASKANTIILLERASHHSSRARVVVKMVSNGMRKYGRDLGGQSSRQPILHCCLIPIPATV
jgi:hypothetical protein